MTTNLAAARRRVRQLIDAAESLDASLADPWFSTATTVEGAAAARG